MPQCRITKVDTIYAKDQRTGEILDVPITITLNFEKNTFEIIAKYKELLVGKIEGIMDKDNYTNFILATKPAVSNPFDIDPSAKHLVGIGPALLKALLDISKHEFDAAGLRCFCPQNLEPFFKKMGMQQEDPNFSNAPLFKEFIGKVALKLPAEAADNLKKRCERLKMAYKKKRDQERGG